MLFSVAVNRDLLRLGLEVSVFGEKTVSNLFLVFFFFCLLHENFLADMRGILREMMSQQEVSSEFQKMSEVLNYFATTY